MRAVGMMSGTSLDGIDIALIETDGEDIQSFGAVASVSYDDFLQERALIFGAMEDAASLTDRSARPGRLRAAEEAVTRLNRDALVTFLKDVKADVVGFHGQTVVHRPELGLTVQLGNAAVLAKAAGVPVVHDFRAADMNKGGQGAPLVPVYHRALTRRLGRHGPLAVLNLGGVANITYIGADESLIACDVGPANALLDDLVLARTGRPFDEEGRLAAAGLVDEAILARLLSHSYFDAAPPKSLDRNAFRRWVSEQAGLDALTTENAAALLTAFTAAAIARILPLLPQRPQSWIVAGGGARNPEMIRQLRRHVAPAHVETADDVGWSGDHVEAQAFAYLAVRSLKGLPLSFPGTTGVSAPVSGGVVAHP